MRMSFILSLAVFSISAFAQELKSVPFYFASPEDAHFPLKDESWKKIPVSGVNSDKLYLRGYHFADNSVVGRKAAFKELLAKEVIQTGDIVLSFRPTWENTIPYAHIQMGVSHAGIAYVDNGVVKNLDMPLDAEYNGNNLAAGFDSKHYLETSHLQIVRPRQFDETKKRNLKAWIAELKKNYVSIRSKGLMRFNSDYSAAKIDRYSAGDSFVTKLGRILNGLDKTSTDLTMFCSEYAWALLSLSSCIPADPEIMDKTVGDASCVTPIFEAMNMARNGGVPGLTEGPLLALKALDANGAEEVELLKKLFTQGEMSGLSPGHRALATNPQMAALVEALKMLYPASLSGNDGLSGAITGKINQSGGRNYSPTAFLINTMLDSMDPERKFDYVATISFGK